MHTKNIGNMGQLPNKNKTPETDSEKTQNYELS